MTPPPTPSPRAASAAPPSAHRPGCAHVGALALLLTGGARPTSSEFSGTVGAAAPLRDQERTRRTERAQSGLFTVTASAGPRQIYGDYEVSSPSGRSYGVRLRALDQPHNSCACPDFAQNLLGTCKHIEAVLAHLASKPRLRAALARARREGAAGAYLYLAHLPQTEVRLHRAGAASARFARRWFDPDGRPRLASLDCWPELLAEAAACGVEVPAEVERWTSRALEQAARERRQQAVEAEVREAGAQQPGFVGRLYPYQVEGVAFLASRGRALLADDMGLGKTAQAIAAMARLFRRGEIARALVVCPASLKHQWARELARFTQPALGTTVVGGTREQRVDQYEHAREVVITSYELLRSDERDIARLAPDQLVLDEAQRIKNWRTRTADVVKRVPTRLAYVLTGTTLENRLDDLYSLMQVVDPHVLGPLWQFNRDFTELDERGRVKAYRNLAELRARLKPHLLRRRKEEVLLQLPERIVSRLSVPLDAAQRELHDEAGEVVARLLSVLRRRPLSPVEEQRLMRAFQRMRMACDAASLVDAKGAPPESPKLQELERLLDEVCVQGGHKAVVFSEWTGMQQLAARVASRLHLKHVCLNGSVPSHQRGALIDQFQQGSECRVFFSTDAGGVGLNLQSADYLINLDLPWNPAVLAQRIGRIHRLGQKNVVNVVLLLGEESLESRMEATLEGKRELFAAAVDADSATDTVERAGLARRVATLLPESFAAPTGPQPSAAPTAPVAPPARDPVEALREAAGAGLERVLRTRDGRLIGLLADGASTPPVELAPAGALLLPAAAAQALGAFNEGSPLSGAEVIFERPAPVDPEAARRAAQLEAAERKLRGARALREQQLGCEALGLVRDALALLCRAAAERDPGSQPAALLGCVHTVLVPGGAVSAAEASALSRAGEIARAFAEAIAQPPEAIVTAVADEAMAMAQRLRGAVGA